MDDATIDSLAIEGSKHGLEVDGKDAVPSVRLAKNLNSTARLLGQLMGRMDLFDLNGDLIYFDHRDNQKRMTPGAFMTWLNERVYIYSHRDKDENKVWATLDKTTAGAILESQSFLSGVRELRGTNRVQLPVLRANGKLELLPKGYDEETGIFTIGEIEYEQDMDVAIAKSWIREVFGGFPFAEERALAVQVTALLALFTKAMLPEGVLRPGFLWMANKPGSGKSVCAKSSLYHVLGSAAAAKMKKGEELDKELEAFSRNAMPYIFLDNVYGGLASASIDALLTTTESMGRAMGGHGVFVAKNSALLLVTGNELKLKEDAARRFLLVDLFERGNPEDRKVTEPLDDERMKSPEWRRKTLAACWALVRNWEEMGRPTESKTLPTFERFCSLNGGIVMAAGWPDPIVPSKGMDFAAPDKSDLKELLHAIAADIGAEETKEFTSESLAKIARRLDIFGDKVGTLSDGIAETISKEKLKGAETAMAEDMGYLNKSQQSSWGIFLKKQIGTQWETDGKHYELGDRAQKRKSSFTVRILKS